jgi:hypothetical protein
MEDLKKILKILLFVFIILGLLLGKVILEENGIRIGAIGVLLAFVLAYAAYIILIKSEFSDTYRYRKYIEKCIHIPSPKFFEQASQLILKKKFDDALMFIERHQNDNDLALEFLLIQIQIIIKQNNEVVNRLEFLLHENKIKPFGDLHHILFVAYKALGRGDEAENQLRLKRNSKCFFFKN